MECLRLMIAHIVPISAEVMAVTIPMYMNAPECEPLERLAQIERQLPKIIGMDMVKDGPINMASGAS